MIAGFMWVTEEEDLQRCYALRHEVFTDEQGFEDDCDAIDATAHHLLVLDDETPVANLRVFFEDDHWHAGRICVKASYRGTGLGKFLMEECVIKLKELGRSNRLVLGAQHDKQGFYERCGFVAFGDLYLDEDYPHQMMELTW